jgi:hypothetical protein
VVLAQGKVVEDFDSGVALQQRIASSGPLVPVLGYCADTHQAVYPVGGFRGWAAFGIVSWLSQVNHRYVFPLHPPGRCNAIACGKYFSRGSADAYAAMPHLTLKERLNILTVRRLWLLYFCVSMTVRAPCAAGRLDSSRGLRAACFSPRTWPRLWPICITAQLGRAFCATATTLQSCCLSSWSTRMAGCGSMTLTPHRLWMRAKVGEKHEAPTLGAIFRRKI